MSGPHGHALYLHGATRLHRLPAVVKVAALLLFVAAVVATPREAFGSFAVEAVLVAFAIAWAKIPARFVARRLLIEVPFVLFAVMMPFLGGGERVPVGPLMLSREGLWGAWAILVKGTLGVSASILLAATTEVADLLEGLERLKVPRLMIAIAGFMVRYLDVVAGEVRRMRVAMASRGYAPRWAGDAGPMAAAAGALFIRSYERGERVHRAMLARGYTGTMPVFDQEPPARSDWLVGMAIPAVAWVASLAGWVLR